MALTKCKECGKEVSTGAKACPSCGARRTSPATMGLAWILGIFLLIGFLGSIFSGSPDSGQPSDGAVYLTATRIIQKRLTSPATAKFPSFYEDGAVNFTSLGGNDYQIDSYVDSQNAFGAMVRTRYRAKIKVDGDRVALTDFDTK